MKANEKSSSKVIRRDKKAEEALENKREAAKAAVPSIITALKKFQKKTA